MKYGMIWQSPPDSLVSGQEFLLTLFIRVTSRFGEELEDNCTAEFYKWQYCEKRYF